MTPFHDKPLNPLLDDPPAQQPYSDGPLRLLWRPDGSSSPEFSSTDQRRGKRGSRQCCSIARRGRIAIFVGTFAAGIALLTIWLLLLLFSSPNDHRRPEYYSTSLLNTTPTPRRTTIPRRKASTNQHQRHHKHHNIVIHVTATPPTQTTRTSSTSSSTTPATTTATSTTTTSFTNITANAYERPQRTNTELFVVKMELLDEGEGSRTEGRGEEGRVGESGRVVAQMERHKATGTSVWRTTESATMTREKWLETTVPATKWTEENPEKKQLTTISMEGMRASVAGKDELEEEEEEEEDEEDLLWGISGAAQSSIRQKLPSSMPSTVPSSSPRPSTTAFGDNTLGSTFLPSSDRSDQKRPIIEFGPMKAVEMEGLERERTRENEQKVREELNEIIESVEREAVKTVVIPFDPSGAPDIPVPEPVWRRPPPDEQPQRPLPPPLRKEYSYGK